MVGIVLISHSAGLADGAADLVGQIAGGARVVPAGGTEDGGLGTSARLILEAIAKADQGAGGAVVNVLAYKADYVAASEELKVLDVAARAKNCENPANWRSNSAVR